MENGQRTGRQSYILSFLFYIETLKGLRFSSVNQSVENQSEYKSSSKI